MGCYALMDPDPATPREYTDIAWPVYPGSQCEVVLDTNAGGCTTYGLGSGKEEQCAERCLEDSNCDAYLYRSNECGLIHRPQACTAESWTGDGDYKFVTRSCFSPEEKYAIKDPW